MFACLSAAELKVAGWSPYQIRLAQTCCLKRVRQGVYLVVKQCLSPNHSYVAKVAAAEVTHLPKESTGMRKRDEDLRILVRSYVRELPPGAVFSHKSALIVHGLPIPYLERDEPLFAETVHLAHGVRRRTIVIRKRELGEGDSTVVEGIRVTSILRTLSDIARDYPLSFAVAVIDSAIHQSYVTAADIRAYTEARPRRTLQHRIDSALTLMDGRREAVSESICAVRFVEYSIPGFEPQVTIRDEDGSFVARTDFANEDAKVIAEFDGEGKYYLPGSNPRKAFELERQREYKLRNLGYAVFRLRWQDLFGADVFLRIRERVERSLAGAR